MIAPYLLLYRLVVYRMKRHAHMKRKRIHSQNLTTEKNDPKTRPEKARRASSFGEAIQEFTQHVESLARASDITMKTMAGTTKKAKKSLDDFMKAKGVRTVEKDGSESYRIKPEDLTSFKRHVKDLFSSALALRNVPRMFLSSLVHHYDAYLGHLLRVAYYVKPELLNASQRHLTFTELVALTSVDAARDFIIEKEVETVIRDSHSAQFDWMESHFTLTLRKELPAWPRFIEITERRNLFVHCDGIVSSQYLSVCRKHGVTLPKDLKHGDDLNVSPEYFSSAVECILEIGIKLGNVLWRKLQPDMLQDADKHLHRSTYTALTEEWYSLAKVLLHFAVDTLKKQSSEESRCMNLINLAIAHNFSGEREQALAILKSNDWSASEDKFKLAVAVLEHRHSDAVHLMKRIGTHGSVTRTDYSTWPLFKEFRHKPEFLATYRDLFGEDFILPKVEQEQKQHETTTKPPAKTRKKRAVLFSTRVKKGKKA